MSKRLGIISVRHKAAIVVVAFVVSFLATLVSMPNDVLATNHGGPIAADETWNKTGNPHNIVSDVTVNSGVTLPITEGVNVTFALGTNLYIYGDLVVSGTASEPVTFTSTAFLPQSGDWGSIHFYVSGGGMPPSSQIDHAVVEYGSTAIHVTNRTMAVHNSIVRYNQIGIDVYNSSLTVDYSTIHDNDYDGINWTAIGPGYLSSIDNNNITNNGGRGINGSAGATVTINSNSISFNQYGIYFVDSTPATSQNNIFNNSENGVYLMRSGNGTSISNNTISNNSKNGIWVSTSSVKIDNNTMENNGLNGTYLVNYNGTFENNTVLNNSGSGVYLVDSSAPFLQYNNITLNGIHGVYSYYSSITLRENNITYNSVLAVCGVWYCEYGGIFADYGATLQIDHNRVENNTVNGIFLRYVTLATVTDNSISDHVSNTTAAMGVYGKETRLNVFRNSMVRNWEDVLVKYDQQPQQPSRIENNTMHGSGDAGVFLYDHGSTTMIANNSLTNVWRGIALMDSSAKVYNNHIQNVQNWAIQLDEWTVIGQSSNEDVFNNTIINATGGILLDVDSGESASPLIRNNSITGSVTSGHGIHIIGYGSATPLIKYNTIKNIIIQYGISITRSNAHPQIINNTITNNNIGIRLTNGANATIHGCNIYSNSYFGVQNNDDTILVNAEENWWGDSTGPRHPSNPLGRGDRVSDGVDFVPWLTVPAF